MEGSLVPARMPRVARTMRRLALVVLAAAASTAAVRAAEPLADADVRAAAPEIRNAPAPDPGPVARDPEQAVIRMNGVTFTPPVPDPGEAQPASVVIRFGRPSRPVDPLAASPTETTDRSLVIVFGVRRAAPRCTS